MKRIVQTFVTGSTCFLMLSSSIFAAHAENSNSTYSYDEDEMEVPEEMLLQEDALNAYNTLYSTFEIDENYNYVLPDDYAGEYINDDYKLVIQLTTDDYSYYETILSDYDCVEFRTVDFSYNELYKLADETRNSISANMDEMIYASSGVNVKDNIAKVEVGVPSSAAQNATKVSANSKLPLVIEYVTVEPTEESTAFLSDYASINTQSTQSDELIGGDLISSYNHDATLGICGTHNGKNAVLTAGHGFPLNTKIMHDLNYFGLSIYNKFTNNQYGDFGIIDLYDYTSCTPTNKVKFKTNTVSITSTIYSVPAGTKCHKYGQQSTYATISTIGTEDVTYSISKTQKITIKGLVCSKLDSGASQDGDSGGPVYLYQNGKWTFCGVHSGIWHSASEVYFTPYLHIYGTFTVKTS